MSDAIAPASMKLDATRIDAAIAAINALPRRHEFPTYARDDFKAAKDMGELLAQYDHGEPAWNGTLNLLAKHLLVAPPTPITIENPSELALLDFEFPLRFHHGDVTVDGDLDGFDSVFVTGNLDVAGVVQASYLDSYQDLMVGGDLRCEAIIFMGCALIAGELQVRRFAQVDSQGENLVLGGVVGPCLLGQHDSVADWDSSRVTHHIDATKDKLAELAAVLNVPMDPEDKYTHDIILRAFEAAR